MRQLDLTVFEPGEVVATVSKDGKVALFTISAFGEPVPSDNRMFASGLALDDPIEALDLSVRTYNLLKRQGIHTIGEMAELYDQGEDVMYAIRNFGEKSVVEIGEHVARLRGESDGA